jgi:hypothetical protein
VRRKNEVPLPAWGAPKGRLVTEAAPRVQPQFSPAYLDFERGIRMGNLEPHQRITRILRHTLETRHGTPFITDRWGRGVYWQWICWLPVANRKAKPESNRYNFGCAKFYITLDQDDQTFEAGLQIERAATRAAGDDVRARPDWDFYKLLRGLRRGTPLAREIERLVKEEEFVVRAGAFSALAAFTHRDYKGPAPLAAACRKIPAGDWGGFQLCYVFPRKEILAMTGDDIVAAIEAIFDEVTPTMNLVMTVPCLTEPGKGRET